MQDHGMEFDFLGSLGQRKISGMRARMKGIFGEVCQRAGLRDSVWPGEKVPISEQQEGPKSKPGPIPRVNFFASVKSVGDALICVKLKMTSCVPSNQIR